MQRWVHLKDDWLEKTFSHREPIFYNRLFIKNFGTGKEKFIPE